MINNKRFKKAVFIFATGFIATTSSLQLPMNISQNHVSAEKVSNIKIVIDNKEVKSDVSPIVKKGRTLVPARIISENLGFDVNWDKINQTAILEKYGIEYYIPISEKKITTNDKREMQIDVPAQLINKRTMLPLRAIAEISGASIDWDSKSNTVTVNSNPNNQANEGKLITEASYNGKTVEIADQSWKIQKGDVWLEYGDNTYKWDELEELFPNRLMGNFVISRFKIEDISTGYLNAGNIIQHTNTAINLSDAIRKSGGSSKIIENKLVIDLHPKQKYADDMLAAWEKGENSLEEFWKNTAHVPKEERMDRQARMVNAIQIPSDLGFKLVEVRPYKDASLKDIKYAVKYVGDANNAPQIVKNSGALKAGDKFVITSDNNSPNMGWKKGHYVFQIPSNAKAIHSSGDMRYGWTDSRYDEYAMKYLNAVRTNESDYEYDQSLRLPNLKLTSPVPAQMQWHKDQAIKNYGMKPQTYGVHGSKVTNHYKGGDARMEVLAHSIRNLSYWYKDANGNFKKSNGLSTLLGSGTHAGIMLDRRYDDMSVQNIYRPDLTEITVMTFGR